MGETMSTAGWPLGPRGLLLYNASFSGGRTSGYMVKKLKERYDRVYDILVTFCNTGLEDPRTLDFVHNCDRYFGFNTIWLEAVVHPDLGTGTTHRVTNYESACRDGSVFEAVIAKYGIPNKVFQPCNREMKLRVMDSYRKSVGADHPWVPTAIGIRADEQRRVSPGATEMNLVYPLVNEWPTDKQDVLDWWEEQPFDLGIEEFEGNCKGCFKKSFAKHFQQIDKDPSVYDWHRRMERDYRFAGRQEGERRFFRGNRNTEQLFDLREFVRTEVQRGVPMSRAIKIYEDSGCTESCEMLPTEATA
jgi:hypothetical protein